MTFGQLVRKVQRASGFTFGEAKEVLGLMVESLAVRLGEGERLQFANELPQPLKDMALSVFPSDANSKIDLVEQFMQMQHVARDRAEKQIHAAWEALKDSISAKEVAGLHTQLPMQTLSRLK